MIFVSVFYMDNIYTYYYIISYIHTILYDIYHHSICTNTTLLQHILCYIIHQHSMARV